MYLSILQNLYNNKATFGTLMPYEDFYAYRSNNVANRYNILGTLPNLNYGSDSMDNRYNPFDSYYGGGQGLYNGGNLNSIKDVFIYNSYANYNRVFGNSNGYNGNNNWGVNFNVNINDNHFNGSFMNYSLGNSSVKTDKSDASPEVKESSKKQVSGSNPQKVDLNTDTGKLYSSLGLEKEGLSYEVFSLAMEGYKNLKNKGNGYLGIVDPKTKRYYLIDINNGKFIEKSDVKFGSGDMGAVANANKDGSHATLSGFTQVKEEYASTKSHWSSRAKRLDGLEAGINNNARSKHVVIHSTQYNTTWGCIGFTPVIKNGKQDDAATNAKLRRLFPENTIIFTYPTDVGEYKNLSALC